MESERTARRIGTFGIFPSVLFFCWSKGLAKQQYGIQLGRKSRRKKRSKNDLAKNIVRDYGALLIFLSVRRLI